MAAKKKAKKKTTETKKGFRVSGSVNVSTADRVPEEMQLTAYAFGEDGQLLGSSAVGAEGNFDFSVALRRSADVEVVVAPAADPKKVRRGAVSQRKYKAADWSAGSGAAVLRPVIQVNPALWKLWWPLRICISGHVRNKVTTETGTTYCPVPYAKVEVFDVDRDGCWWPYLYRLRDLLKDRRIVRAEDLLAERLGPVERVRSIISANTSRAEVSLLDSGLDKVGFNPQPEPPGQLELSHRLVGEPVGEIATLDTKEAKSLESVNISSKLAPWILFPWCYYTKEKMCQDFTDCSGYFRCCFPWYPAHWRRGRLRFDFKPDIILRITQVIDGVEKVIYMDPYSSTRWNTGSAHIDIWLDDEQVICGPGCSPDPDLGDCDASILQLGRDNMWEIDRANGLYTVPGTTNGAYGGNLVVRGDFSANFKDGSPPRYYQLSWAKATGGGGLPADSEFHPVQTAMEAYRATPGGIFSTYLLGPKTVGSTNGLYEVQDTGHWWIPKNFPISTPGGMVLGLWPTPSFESGEGLYWLRMEVFSASGSKLNNAKFCNYQGDGSGAPTPPIQSLGRLDQKVRVDNNPMTFDLTTPATNACGVVPWSPGLVLNFTVNANQATGRVHSWQLNYNKGINSTEYLVNTTDPTPAPIGSRGTYNGGIGSVNELVVDDNMGVAGLTTTCAYGLHLYAKSHVRVNYGWHNYGRKSYAIAVEKCPPCNNE